MQTAIRVTKSLVSIVSSIGMTSMRPHLQCLHDLLAGIPNHDQKHILLFLL